RGPGTLPAPRPAPPAAGDLPPRPAFPARGLACRLVRRGASKDIAAEVVAARAGGGYGDDAAFARHWVTTRAARGYGAARLRAELRARGVATALVDAALATLEGEDQLAQARALAR